MRPIPTTAHAVIDYLTAFTLLVAPKLWRLDEVPASAATFYVFGGSLTATSLVTDYELSLANVVPMRAHLALDVASGAALAASPFLLGFRQGGPRYWLPHVAVGASEILTAGMTKPERVSRRSTVALSQGDRQRAGERHAPGQVMEPLAVRLSFWASRVRRTTRCG